MQSSISVKSVLDIHHTYVPEDDIIFISGYTKCYVFDSSMTASLRILLTLITSPIIDFYDPACFHLVRPLLQLPLHSISLLTHCRPSSAPGHPISPPAPQFHPISPPLSPPSPPASPSVLLDSPAGLSSDVWLAVLPRLSQLTRTCVFDRPGLGFSDRSVGWDVPFRVTVGRFELADVQAPFKVCPN